MLVTRTAAGLALSHLDRLEHYRVGVDAAADHAVGVQVEQVIEGLPWITGIPVRTLLCTAGCFVFLRTGTTLDRVDGQTRGRLADALRRIPLFSMVDKLVVTVTYLRSFDVQPLAGAGPE